MSNNFQAINVNIPADDEPIPTLIVRPPGEQPRPVCIVLHGHTGYKEDTQQWLIAGAAQGMVMVAIDARLHGARGPLERDQSDPAWRFYHIVRDTAVDVSKVADWLLAQPHLCDGRLALVGGSMGGYITLAVAVRDRRFDPLISICGGADHAIALRDNLYVPDADKLLAEAATLDPINHLDSFYPRRLLMIHGERDDVVPYQGQLNLYRALSPYYVNAADRIALISHPGGHETPPIYVQVAQAWLVAQMK